MEYCLVEMSNGKTYAISREEYILLIERIERPIRSFARGETPVEKLIPIETLDNQTITLNINHVVAIEIKED